ncbi:MAG: ribosome small subunit-dependent GTPase A [Bacteroidota bacterium]
MPENEVSTPATPPTADGIVIRSTGSWYDVRTPAGVVPAKMRGKFRLRQGATTNPVAVGDNVSLRLNADETGLITEIHPRRNKLSRRAAGRRVGKEHVIVSNIDAALVMQSVELPKPNPGFVDRFLVMATYHDLEAGIILNKTDLQNENNRGNVAYFKDIYQDLGYSIFLVSAKSGEGMDALREFLNGKVSVIAGPSGAGKSTLLNALEPDLDLPTGEVSLKTKKGRHTTTNAALFPINATSYVADTPGIREYGLFGITAEDLGHYYPEFEPYLNQCKFPNCMHDHEPACAVKDAVEQDEIHPTRFHNYLSILDSLYLGEKDVGR